MNCLCILVDTPDHQSICSKNTLYMGERKILFYHVMLVLVSHQYQNV